MRKRRPATPRQKAYAAILLSAVAGYVDAVGYLSLRRIYTANMSGNTVDFGVRLAQWNLTEACRRGWPILAFVCGMMASAAMLDIATRAGVESRCSLTFSCELLLLSAFGAFGAAWGSQPQGFRFYFEVALAALAMGLQNATLTRAGPLSVRTTHVTGMLVEFAEMAAALLLAAVAGANPRSERADGAGGGLRKRAAPAWVAILACVWVGFASGGAAGAAAEIRWGPASVIAPCCVLSVLIGADLLRPLAPADYSST